MKKLNEMLHDATTLNKSEMKNVKGGISEEEYCGNLHTIISNEENWIDMDDDAKMGASYGWLTAGCNRFFDI